MYVKGSPPMCTAQNVHTEVPQPRQLAATNITATARLLGADRRKKVHTGGGRFDPSTYQIWANWGAGTEGGAGHMYGLYEASRDPQWPPLLDLGVRGPVCQRSRLSEVHPHHMR